MKRALLAVFFAATLTQQNSLRADLDAIFDDAVLARALVGVRIDSLTTGENIYRRNDDKLVMPASNMKILTMTTAAEKLGWDFTYKTHLDAIMGSHQARAENNRTQIQALQAAQESEEIKARIENLRSAAVLNLAKAGTTQVDAHTQQMLAVLDALDRMVGWHQNAAQMQQPAEQQQAA